jgi:hypothetical protein
MIEVETAWVAFTAVDARVLEQVGKQSLARAPSALSLAPCQVRIRNGPVVAVPRGVALATSRLPAVG